MAEPVECRLQVGVECPQPFGILAGCRGVDGHDRVMAAAAGPESVGPRLEPGLPLRFGSAADARACSALSAITGMPSGRRRPLLLGTCTRLTGRGLHAAAPCCSQAAMSAFSQLASTMRPSTPAVLRPALTSVTRRTLTRALLRERSISFCKLRTLERSPACDAAKIRRLSRRTCSSAWPQSAVSQSRPSSSGPFTRSVSNLSLGSGVLTILSSQAHRDPPSALFRAGQQPYPASYAGTAGGGASIWSRFPAAFRPPAFASRVFLRPLGDSASLTVGLPADSPPDPIGVVTFRMR